jgi:hypothetical protein
LTRSGQSIEEAEGGLVLWYHFVYNQLVLYIPGAFHLPRPFSSDLAAIKCAEREIRSQTYTETPTTIFRLTSFDRCIFEPVHRIGALKDAA